MHKNIIAMAVATGGFLMAGGAAATCANIIDVMTERPYTLNINDSTVGRCASVNESTAQGFIDALKTTRLTGLFPGANSNTDGISAQASFNSLLVNLHFQPSSPQLSFVIPELGINEAFNGRTRDESLDKLEDYLKNNNVIGRIMNYQAKHSPFSPITGQGGLIPTTVASDFGSSFLDVATNVAAPAALAKEASQDGKAGNLLQVGLNYGSGKINSTNTKFLSIPLSYTFRNDIDPRRQLVLQLPITYSDIGGAKSIQAGFGLAYRIPMSDRWTLTPGIKYSFVGSEDLATVAGLYSATIGSAYIIPMTGFDIAIGNMLGIYKTGKFSSGDYAFNPDITTTGMRNGIMLLQPVTIKGSKMSLEYSFIDTRYFGDKPFADNSQEIGITLGTNKSAFSARSFVRAGLGYAHSKSGNTWKMNFGYWF
ncbi:MULTISPECIES: hypothetical protein [Giesbergeria]|uniref:Uncharacterized protein n=1 Tax=Giesbergeria sinuosa TaxID=80883 RepID=A0ABV9Q9B4_9BURK